MYLYKYKLILPSMISSLLLVGYFSRHVLQRQPLYLRAWHTRWECKTSPITDVSIIKLLYYWYSLVGCVYCSYRSPNISCGAILSSKLGHFPLLTGSSCPAIRFDREGRRRGERRAEMDVSIFERVWSCLGCRLSYVDLEFSLSITSQF